MTKSIEFTFIERDYINPKGRTNIQYRNNITFEKNYISVCKNENFQEKFRSECKRYQLCFQLSEVDTWRNTYLVSFDPKLLEMYPLKAFQWNGFLKIVSFSNRMQPMRKKR